jgi:hypothetical protein
MHEKTDRYHTFLFSFAGCGIYSFKNTSLPSHIKTVDIPLMENPSLEPNMLMRLQVNLIRKLLEGTFSRSPRKRVMLQLPKDNRLRKLSLYLWCFRNRNADVDQYAVKITAEIEFFDNKENVPIFKGTINGEGIYNFKTETELAGRTLAVKNIIQRLLESSMQSW